MAQRPSNKIAVHSFLKSASMADRPAKLKKLNDFRRRLPHVTASALSAILEDLKKNGIPEGNTDRNALREARNLQNSKATKFGAVLQTLDVHDVHGGVEQVAIAHPLALLCVGVEDNDSFGAFLRQKLMQHPPSPEQPWSLLMYTDEVTPGNPLATLNKRKFHAIYWSFLEFGIEALSREESWFTVVTAYSTHVKNVSAGLSQLVAAVLKCFFSDDGANLALGGVLLPFGEDGIRLWAKLGGLLQDGGAHKSVWHSRGDGACKFCILCKNLFDEESKVVDEDGTNLLRCNVLKFDELELASSSDLRKTARYLESKQGTTPPGEFTNLQKALGMTHHKHALLLTRSLDAYVDPVAIYMHDWMHALFVDGVFNLVLYLLLETIIQIGFNDVYSVFSNYIANWKWPERVHAAHLHEIFEDSRKDKHRKAMHIKCQASDGLSLVGVAALFVHNVLLLLEKRGLTSASCNNECYAFLALVDVIELIVASSKTNVPPQKLLTAVEKFLELFAHAWGVEWMVSKFHWLLHLPDPLARSRFKKLLNCFCLERKHRVPKRYATELTNPSKKNSKSLLMEVTSHHLGQLSNADAFAFDVGLVGASKARKNIKQILTAELDLEPADASTLMVSMESRFNALATCKKGDVILYKAGLNSFRAGVVDLHFSIHGSPITLISAYVLHKLESYSGYSTWEFTDEQLCIETTDILETVVYSFLADGKLAVLLPLGYR